MGEKIDINKEMKEYGDQAKKSRDEKIKEELKYIDMRLKK